MELDPSTSSTTRTMSGEPGLVCAPDANDWKISLELLFAVALGAILMHLVHLWDKRGRPPIINPELFQSGPRSAEEEVATATQPPPEVSSNNEAQTASLLKDSKQKEEDLRNPTQGKQSQVTRSKGSFPGGAVEMGEESTASLEESSEGEPRRPQPRALPLHQAKKPAPKQAESDSEEGSSGSSDLSSDSKSVDTEKATKIIAATTTYGKRSSRRRSMQAKVKGLTEEQELHAIISLAARGEFSKGSEQGRAEAVKKAKRQDFVSDDSAIEDADSKSHDSDYGKNGTRTQSQPRMTPRNHSKSSSKRKAPRPEHTPSRKRKLDIAPESGFHLYPGALHEMPIKGGIPVEKEEALIERFERRKARHTLTDLEAGMACLACAYCRQCFYLRSHDDFFHVFKYVKHDGFFIVDFTDTSPTDVPDIEDCEPLNAWRRHTLRHVKREEVRMVHLHDKLVQTTSPPPLYAAFPSQPKRRRPPSEKRSVGLPPKKKIPMEEAEPDTTTAGSAMRSEGRPLKLPKEEPTTTENRAIRRPRKFPDEEPTTAPATENGNVGRSRMEDE